MSSLSDKVPRLVEETAKYPRGEADLSYGTSGFRADAEILSSAAHRLGMLATLRSKSEGKITGVMVTASHNKVSDNGMKIVDPMGFMLAQNWEQYAEQLVNASTEKVLEVLDAIVASEKIDLDQTGSVFVARDTRPSSENLAELAREGALVMGGNVLDFGLQTTPQLHHLVRMWNYEQFNKGDWASEVGYYHMLSDAFKQLIANLDSNKLEMRTPLFVDCAHGVGALQLSKLSKELNETLHLEVFNTPSDGELNHECGADFVEKHRSVPTGVNTEQDGGKRFCSLDGDADRLIYHFVDRERNFHILDGGYMACLFADFYQHHLSTLAQELDNVSFGCVLTAYGNGAARRYLESRGVNVTVAATGVKHCFAAASKYDVGIFFEANGHGTVLVNEETAAKLQKLEGQMHDEKKKTAVAQLMAAHQLLHQATGDALSDLLLVEALLAQRGWGVDDWGNMYQDLPSRQTKVQVEDRSIIQVDDESEEHLKAPSNLKDAVEQAVNKHEQGRGFVRPSGTENVVRVYAEAATQEAADELALELVHQVHQLAGGQGEAPTIFQ